MDDTIYALATASGKAGVAVIRVSGPESVNVLLALGASCPEPSFARVRTLYDRVGGVLDKALVLHFEEGRSFTGQTTIEVHVHGSIAVIRAILAAIDMSGLARGAKAGEFTERALLNGRIDLTEVQGLGDLIQAETEQQRVQAMRLFGGELTNLAESWRSLLLRACALIEASIDFVEEDVPHDVMPEVTYLLRSVTESIEAELTTASYAMRLRHGFEVAIVGEVNVGKSTLLNALAKSELAIVSEYPGTTRDVIEARLDIHGIPVIFLDTAGLRETSDPVEKIGIDRAHTRANAADLRIFLYDGLVVPKWSIGRQLDDMIIRSKSDLHDGEGVSGLTGLGLTRLIDRVFEVLEPRSSSAGIISTERDLRSVKQILRSIALVLSRADELPLELLAEELRVAVNAADGILGKFEVEAILGEVFRSFCIGK